jgi:hypothetical protein
MRIGLTTKLQQQVKTSNKLLEFNTTFKMTRKKLLL